MLQLESSDSSCSSESASDRRLAGRYSRGRLLFLFGIMTAFFFCFNGTNFGFFNFLTALAMRHPRLGLPKSAGARATTVYFASSAVARLVRFFSKKSVIFSSPSAHRWSQIINFVPVLKRTQTTIFAPIAKVKVRS